MEYVRIAQLWINAMAESYRIMFGAALPNAGITKYAIDPR